MDPPPVQMRWLSSLSGKSPSPGEPLTHQQVLHAATESQSWQGFIKLTREQDDQQEIYLTATVVPLASQSGEIVRFHLSGHEITALATLAETWAPARYLCSTQDISSQMASEEGILWGARHDVLTELPNRSYFLQQL